MAVVSWPAMMTVMISSRNFVAHAAAVLVPGVEQHGEQVSRVPAALSAGVDNAVDKLFELAARPPISQV